MPGMGNTNFSCVVEEITGALILKLAGTLAKAIALEYQLKGQSNASTRIQAMGHIETKRTPRCVRMQS